MRSLWTMCYVGAHTATTIKKLERLLDMKALDVTRERYVWNGENLERSAFFIDHGALDWTALINSLLRKTSLFASAWQSRGDATHILTTRVTSEDISASFKNNMPAGLREVSWEVRADQLYGNGLLSVGSSSVKRW